MSGLMHRSSDYMAALAWMNDVQAAGRDAAWLLLVVKTAQERGRKAWPPCNLVHADSLPTLYRGRLPGLPGVRYLA